MDGKDNEKADMMTDERRAKKLLPSSLPSCKLSIHFLESSTTSLSQTSSFVHR